VREQDRPPAREAELLPNLAKHGGPGVRLGASDLGAQAQRPDPLVEDLLKLLPLAPAVFGEDEITDRSQRFLAGELLRAADAACWAPSFVCHHRRDRALRRRRRAAAHRRGDWVARESQKAIVMARAARGSRRREKSRIQIERLFGARCSWNVGAVPKAVGDDLR
jgi:hypothetical protein